MRYLLACRSFSRSNLAGLTNKGFEHFRLGFQDLGAEAFHVELDCGFDIRYSFFVAIALTDHYALDAEGIGDVAVGVLFNNDLDGTRTDSLPIKFSTGGLLYTPTPATSAHPPGFHQ